MQRSTPPLKEVAGSNFPFGAGFMKCDLHPMVWNGKAALYRDLAKRPRPLIEIFYRSCQEVPCIDLPKRALTEISHWDLAKRPLTEIFYRYLAKKSLAPLHGSCQESYYRELLQRSHKEILPIELL